MSMARTPIASLRRDLKRPGGGWTVGVATIIGACVALLIGTITQSALFGAVGAALLGLHMLWGLGYYPASF